ncbi:ATPase [Weeksellaceae bacterium TAE3-ERU29]|nr:ATPase [Weeksellaceae bacterium TAE3-ERU29]
MNYFNNLIEKNFDRILKSSFYISLLSVILFIYDNGFKHNLNDNKWINYVFISSIIFAVITTAFRHIYTKQNIPFAVKVFDLLSVLLFIYVLYRFFFIHSSLSAFTIFLVFIREFSGMQINYGKNVINPARLFIFSFLAIILLGSFLLMLPQATYNGIPYLDALFTSTSAVCVTGLVTLDFSKDFTTFGQSIVLVLIQIGGLGIMTFASYFSYFFRGSSSYQNQLTLSTFTNNNNLGDVFSTVRRIVLITLIIEILGATLIYFTTSSTQLGEKAIFFSIFHSISAFCNAGFSTLPQGLYNPNFQYDYNLQLIISGLIIFGGLGFPIVYNIYKYSIYKIRNLYRKITGKERVQYIPWLLSINSRITLVTTLSLFLLGFISFFIFEYNSSMSNYDLEGKVVQSIFGSITPRTAGFNTIDMAQLSFPMIMIYFLLMWVGASPGSTGGGIKTSTFAVAFLNFISLAKGKDRIEVYRREISNISLRRAFATMILSLLTIGVGIAIMESYESDKGLLSIAFECFSAYSTVGLSLGITPDLSSVSKVVLIFVMFIGRVSMLSILIALLKREKFTGYRYPTEDILIN